MWCGQNESKVSCNRNSHDVRNPWGITLLSLPGKVYAKVLEGRCSEIVELKIQEEQCGFRTGRSISDYIFALCQIVEKSWEYAQPVCMCFVDLDKAYDRIVVAAAVTTCVTLNETANTHRDGASHQPDLRVRLDSNCPLRFIFFTQARKRQKTKRIRKFMGVRLNGCFAAACRTRRKATVFNTRMLTVDNKLDIQILTCRDTDFSLVLSAFHVHDFRRFAERMLHVRWGADSVLL
ncbi:unnamed protein product [Soboliphyme baturini]|uniref:Reverse transcriptase domain-containing protein n=1 Tax=Soboliphyme baturini TaxID=241478 RepID=A0A183IBD0_9BILA|nr:unnamed protein product [Soboliphyme baturini]